ncbi:hypothetical protein BH23GEM9_BH23GEM9_29120 [soil metagenome]
MQISRIEIQDSPVTRGRVRLRGEVAYTSNGGGTEEYWFEVPQELASGLSTSGNPWLISLLPLAAALHEPLQVPLPVDAELVENASQVMRIWQAWYPQLAVVPLEVTAGGGERPAASRTAALFSGGVDSFFTALRPRESAPPAERGEVDDLITVWGFDIGLDRPEAFARLGSRHREVARELGKRYVEVATNLRTTRWGRTPWGPLAHGCGLAGVALALEGCYGRVLIPATAGYRDLHPWGSHPLTDPLLSTAGTRFVHDGAAHTRIQKTALLISSPVALRSLRVCWESQTEENCGRCRKCHRTMLILELLGALERCTTFPQSRVDLRRAARVYCQQSWDFREYRDIREFALQVGRPDVARAVASAMRRSRRRTWVLDRTRAVRRYLAGLLGKP